MSTAALVLAWLGVAALAAIGGLVHLLVNRVLRSSELFQSPLPLS